MTPELREELLRSVRYFWEERGDPTRYVKWDEACREFPSLGQAWARRQQAELDFNIILKGLCL